MKKNICVVFLLFLIFIIFFSSNIFSTNFDELMDFYGFENYSNNISQEDFDLKLFFIENKDLNLYDKAYVNLTLDLELYNILNYNGSYNLRFYIENFDSYFVGEYVVKNLTLNSNNIIELPVDIFFQSKIDGPYKISVLEIYKKNSFKHSFSSELLSKDISYLEFKRNNLPYILSQDIFYNSSLGIINFSIKNIGEKPAVFFTNKIVASNYSKDFRIDYINPNSSLFFNYNISKNLTNVSILIDTNNDVLMYDNNSFYYDEKIKKEKSNGVNEESNQNIKSSSSSSISRINSYNSYNNYEINKTSKNHSKKKNLSVDNKNNKTGLIGKNIYQNKNNKSNNISLDVNYDFDNLIFVTSYQKYKYNNLYLNNFYNMNLSSIYKQKNVSIINNSLYDMNVLNNKEELILLEFFDLLEESFYSFFNYFRFIYK